MIDLEKTLKPMVKEISKQVARRFPRSVLVEDIEQDLWLWAFQNSKSISKKIQKEPSTWIEQVAATMRRQAMGYGKQEVEAIECTGAVDTHQYSVKEIRSLLPDVFDYEDWQSFGSFGDSQPRAKALVNTTGDRMASLVDVKSVLSNIEEDQYNAIVWHFKYGRTYEQLAVEYGCSPEAARKRVERSVKAVQRLLGHKPQEEYTGRRSVRSNAAWRAASESYYTEE